MAAIQTLKSLRDQVLYWLDEAGDTGTTKQNVDNALNQAHQDRCASQPWIWLLWPRIETITTVSGTQQYSLHSEFWRPVYFRGRTSKQFIVETPLQSLMSSGEDWISTTTAPAYRFMWKGISQIQNQPSSASQITMSSSSTSDTAVTVTIAGETSDGYATETLTLTGTTSVTSVNTYQTLNQLTKSSTTVGTLTVTSNAAAVTNLKLFPNEYGRSYRQIYFLNNPEAEVVEYQFLRQPVTLTNDYDIPDIPPPFAQILVWDTLLLFAGYNTDLKSESVSIWREMRQRIETNMMNVFADQQSLNADAKYINYNPEDDHWA